LGELTVGRDPAPDDDQREYHREQPDYHERKRQSAAHGHPFPSIALGAPLCCDSRPGSRVYALTRAIARGDGLAGCSPAQPFGYLKCLAASPPLVPCSFLA
jgi:hypothetical protein